MNHAIEIAVGFRDQSKPGTFDLWKVILVVEAARSGEAEKRAMSIARQMLDAKPNWEAMGYVEGPTLYAVLSVNGVYAEDLPQRPPLNCRNCLVLLGMGSVTQSELDKLVAYQDVPTSFHALHIEN